VEDQAWAELGKLKDKDADKLRPIVDKYEGTEAHPFLVLALSGKLYERGEKADLELAKALLERASNEVSGNQILIDVIHDELKGISRELGDAKLWANAAPVGSGSK